jgi:hypothetical protein
MLRILFISLIVLLLGYFFLQGRLNERNGEKPVFLRTDEIALNHQTKIQTTVHSIYIPDSLQLESLQKDYSNIWAHLNHLYATNDVEAGKEYYTEDWFKQIVHHYNGAQQPLLTRTDEQHELHIQNWAWDGLVCTAIDSNVVLKTIYPDKTIQHTKANIAVVLLFQGDHWRIDALRLISESAIKP